MQLQNSCKLFKAYKMGSWTGDKYPIEITQKIQKKLFLGIFILVQKPHVKALKVFPQMLKLHLPF
jgi:hypothetical protein